MVLSGTPIGYGYIIGKAELQYLGLVVDNYKADVSQIYQLFTLVPMYPNLL